MLADHQTTSFFSHPYFFENNHDPQEPIMKKHYPLVVSLFRPILKSSIHAS